MHQSREQCGVFNSDHKTVACSGNVAICGEVGVDFSQHVGANNLEADADLFGKGSNVMEHYRSSG